MFAGITDPLRQASDLPENVLSTVKADRASTDKMRRVMVMLSPILRLSYVLKCDITKSASFTLPAGVVVVVLFGGRGGRWVFAAISEL